MKKFFLFTVCVMVLALSSYAQPDRLFIETYKKALELNASRFADLNKIQIGEIVLFPDLSGTGLVQAMVADSPTPAGKHDCIWVLTQKYIDGQLKTRPMEPEAPVSLPPVEKSHNLWWLWALLCLLITWLAVNLWIRSKRPDSHPAMGNDLAGMDRGGAASSLRRFLRPGESFISMRHGRLVRNSGPLYIIVGMEFADRARNVWLQPGERVTTVTIQNANGGRREQHLRTACANGLGTGSFTLPAGWVINYEQTEEEGRLPVPAPVPNHGSSPVPAPLAINYEMVARIIASGKEHDSLSLDVDAQGIHIKIQNKTKSK